MGKINRRVLVTARLPHDIVDGLNSVAEFNESNRTSEIERFLREGIEKARRAMRARYVSFSIMVLTLLSVGFYIYYLLHT